MKRIRADLMLASALLCSESMLAVVQAQPALLTREDQLVASASAVLSEIMAVPAQAIPRSLLSNAHGIAIVPNVVKGGLVVGVRYGRGVLLVRDQQGAWTTPQFISLTGGSIGWQVGVQATDVILVFKSPNSIRGLMGGKLTVGVDAAASAGPVGRNAAAATDTQLRAEIYSYSRSRGLFAGVSIDGSSLQIDHIANAAYYQRAGTVAANSPPAAAPPVPATAVRLINQVAAYTASPRGAPPIAIGEQANSAAVVPASPEQLRQQVVASVGRLHALLDPQWQAYLALPADVATGSPVNLASVEQMRGRFDAVSANPQYVEISARPEFQATHQLLRIYSSALRAAPAGPTGRLQLPPPPGNNDPYALP